MRRSTLVLFAFALFFAIHPAWAKNDVRCAKISDGGLFESVDNPAVQGKNQWGYNYQAHRYDGTFCNHIPYFREGNPGGEWCKEKRADYKLTMKWNDAWLSDRSCDGDEFLDQNREPGSGAWYTSKFEWEKTKNGKPCKWSHFVKFVAPPVGSYKLEDIWYDKNNVELGPSRGGMILIKEVVHDDCSGINGNVDDPFMSNKGLGSWK